MGFESRVAGLFGVLRKLLLYNRMMDLFWCMDKKKKKSSIRVRLATRDSRPGVLLLQHPFFQTLTLTHFSQQGTKGRLSCAMKS